MGDVVLINTGDGVFTEGDLHTHFKPMTFKLNKRLNRRLDNVNRFINQAITDSDQTIYTYENDMVSFYHAGQDAVLGGYYTYNRKGQVTDWSVTDLTRYYEDQVDPLFRFTFEVDGTENFKKNVRHLSQTIYSDSFLGLFDDMFKTSDGSTMASYLDQLEGVAAGDYSTAVQTHLSDQFYFA